MAKDFQDWDAGLHRKPPKSLRHSGVLGMKKGVRHDGKPSTYDPFKKKVKYAGDNIRAEMEMARKMGANVGHVRANGLIRNSQLGTPAKDKEYVESHPNIANHPKYGAKPKKKPEEIMKSVSPQDIINKRRGQILKYLKSKR